MYKFVSAMVDSFIYWIAAILLAMTKKHNATILLYISSDFKCCRYGDGNLCILGYQTATNIRAIVRGRHLGTGQHEIRCHRLICRTGIYII